MTAKRETSEWRERMTGECHVCFILSACNTTPRASPPEENAHTPESCSSQRTNTRDMKGGGSQENESGRQIQMKEEMRRSNCDKGTERQNYRVKESGKCGERKCDVEHDAPRSPGVGSLTL